VASEASEHPFVVDARPEKAAPTDQGGSDAVDYSDAPDGIGRDGSARNGPEIQK